MKAPCVALDRDRLAGPDGVRKRTTEPLCPDAPFTALDWSLKTGIWFGSGPYLYRRVQGRVWVRTPLRIRSESVLGVDGNLPSL